MKLNPCPYCGNEKVSLQQWMNGMYFVQCERYDCPRKEFVVYESKEEAVKMWNEGKPDE